MRIRILIFNLHLQLPAHVPHLLFHLSVLRGESGLPVPLPVLALTLARGPGGANQHGRAVLSAAVVAELLPVAALPQIDGRAMLYSVHVSAGLLVAVVATDQCFACDDAVLVVKLDAIAVGGEKRSLAKKFVVLKTRF